MKAQTPNGPCNSFNPKADFVTNFNNPCFTVGLYSGGGLNLSGDANAIYDTIDFVVTPGYELVLLGTFPNSRFMAVTAYDAHLAIPAGGSIIDQQILPLNNTMFNPYEVGANYQPGQQYGLTIGFGSILTTTPAAGCSAADTTIDNPENFLNASMLHTLPTWNGDPAVFGPPYDFSAFHISGANPAGLLMVRKYVNPFGTPLDEKVIVRKTSNGCAVPASQVKNVVLFQGESLTWPNFAQQQIQYHQDYSNGVETLECYNPDPNNAKQWFGAVDYVPLESLGAALDINLTPTNLAPLFSGHEFIRLRFPAPTTPTIPCATGNCSLTGLEDLRYYSLSFMGGTNGYGLVTLASLDDTAFVKDANGDVTLLINLAAGVTPPSFVTQANSYNYLDLTQYTNYTAFSRIELRSLLPNATFDCSAANVPPFTMEYFNIDHTQPGGFMGAYVPTIDFPAAAALSVPPASPPYRPNTCAIPPPGPPVACGPVDLNLYPQP